MARYRIGFWAAQYEFRGNERRIYRRVFPLQTSREVLRWFWLSRTVYRFILAFLGDKLWVLWKELIHSMNWFMVTIGDTWNFMYHNTRYTVIKTRLSTSHELDAGHGRPINIVVIERGEAESGRARGSWVRERGSGGDRHFSICAPLPLATLSLGRASRLDKILRRKSMETMQQPSKTRSGRHLSCCFISILFLCDIATPIIVALLTW